MPTEAHRRTLGRRTRLRFHPVCRLRGHDWYEKNSETDCCHRCGKCRRGQ